MTRRWLVSIPNGINPEHVWKNLHYTLLSTGCGTSEFVFATKKDACTAVGLARDQISVRELEEEQ